MFKFGVVQQHRRKGRRFWLSESNRTDATPSPPKPVNTNDCAGTLVALTINPSPADPNSTPAASYAVAVHCGCDTPPDPATNPARVHPNACCGVPNTSVKLTGWFNPACVK